MKITIKGWLTPDAYAGVALPGQVPNVAVKVDVEVELPDSLAEAIIRVSGITDELASWDFNRAAEALADIADKTER